MSFDDKLEQYFENKTGKTRKERTEKIKAEYEKVKKRYNIEMRESNVFSRKDGRDTNRIVGIVQLLEYYWKKNSDLRFAQVVEIIKSRAGYDDMFYIEDDVIEKILEGMIKEQLDNQEI